MNKVLKFFLNCFAATYILVSMCFGFFFFQELKGMKKSQNELDGRISFLEKRMDDHFFEQLFAMAIDDLNGKIDDLERRVSYLEIQY